jgi:cbb3-type cytochrome oxidase subunit 3
MRCGNDGGEAVTLWDMAMAARPLMLVWLFAIFVGLVWRAWRVRAAEHQHHAMIPLRDGDA